MKSSYRTTSLPDSNHHYGKPSLCKRCYEYLPVIFLTFILVIYHLWLFLSWYDVLWMGWSTEIQCDIVSEDEVNVVTMSIGDEDPMYEDP